MSDTIDQAQELDQRHREQAIAACKPAIEQPNEKDGFRYCVACDEEIPVKRIEANPNAVRCIDCQGLLEIRQRQGRK